MTALQILVLVNMKYNIQQAQIKIRKIRPRQRWRTNSNLLSSNVPVKTHTGTLPDVIAAPLPPQTKQKYFFFNILYSERKQGTCFFCFVFYKQNKEMAK